MTTCRDNLKAAAIAGLFGLFVMMPQPTLGADKTDHPNIVLILADDMGIDSIQALNDANPVPSPSLDTLLEQGINFTDAHSNASVCTPTRYGILTGRYAWRSRLKKRVLGQYASTLIKEERLTLPDVLRAQGYATACIGKWHLGWEWPKKGGGFTSRRHLVDYTGQLEGGAMAAGFDYYFGVDAPNFVPYVWIENGKMLGVPNTEHSYKGRHPGIGVEGWDMEAILPTLTEKCVDYINQKADGKKPFFLFFPMTSPHTPIAPSKAFQGISGINIYTDFMMETDWSIGQIMKALEDNGIADNTLLIFTADNGTSRAASFSVLEKSGVDLRNNWRGMKADGFEGGHRVPFIARWPKHIEPGSESDEIISTVDFMATFADVVGVDLPDTAAEDSVSLLPVLTGEKREEPLHEAVICHSIDGVFVVRKGKWKLQYSAGSGGWSQPSDKAAIEMGLPKWQLYDLYNDPKETTNLVNSFPEVVVELTKILRGFVEQGRSTPGEPQKNHNGEIWWEGIPWDQNS